MCLIVICLPKTLDEEALSLCNYYIYFFVMSVLLNKKTELLKTKFDISNTLELEKELIVMTGLEKERVEGKIEGAAILISTLKEMGVAKDFIIKTLVEKFNFSLEQAEKYYITY